MKTIKMFDAEGNLRVVQDRPRLVARYVAEGWAEAPADAKPKKAAAKKKKAAAKKKAK